MNGVITVVSFKKKCIIKKYDLFRITILTYTNKNKKYLLQNQSSSFEDLSTLHKAMRLQRCSK